VHSLIERVTYHGRTRQTIITPGGSGRYFYSFRHGPHFQPEVHARHPRHRQAHPAPRSRLKTRRLNHDAVISRWQQRHGVIPGTGEAPCHRAPVSTLATFTSAAGTTASEGAARRLSHLDYRIV